MFSFSSRLKPSVKTVRDIVKELENKCLKTEDHGSCGDIHSKLVLECIENQADYGKKCIRRIDRAMKIFCDRNGKMTSQICSNRKPRVINHEYGIQNPRLNRIPPDIPSPTPEPVPNPKPAPEVPPAPEPEPPKPETANSSSKGTLLIGAFLFGVFVCIVISGIAAYYYYTKQQERQREEERKRLEQARMEKRKKRRMKKKKSKIIVKEKTGEETKVERREAKQKDRAEEEQKWKQFEEANQKENTFLNP